MGMIVGIAIGIVIGYYQPELVATTVGYVINWIQSI